MTTETDQTTHCPAVTAGTAPNDPTAATPSADTPAVAPPAQGAGLPRHAAGTPPPGPPAAHEPDRTTRVTAQAAARESRRTLKLVITLRPAPSAADPGERAAAAGGEPREPTYHAVLAVGADGCDPCIRPVSAGRLGAVLAEVPAFVADAEAGWQMNPRYPSTGPPAKATNTARRRAAQAERPEERTAPSLAAAPPPPKTGGDAGVARPIGKPARVPPPGQLSLFG